MENNSYLVKYIEDFAKNNSYESYTHEPVKFTIINKDNIDVEIEQSFQFQNEYFFLVNAFFIDFEGSKRNITKENLIYLKSANDSKTILDPLYNHLTITKIKVFCDWLNIKMNKMPSNSILVLEGIKINVKTLNEK